MMSKRILITGGKGFIGKIITEKLVARGDSVSWLTRNPNKNSVIKEYFWDIKSGEIDPLIAEKHEYVIHLAGAPLNGRRWNNKYKKELTESRVKSSNLLYSAYKTQDVWPLAFISASAVGYYGSDLHDTWKTESDQPGDDFLSRLTCEWETAANQFRKKITRAVTFRIGVALSNKEGALPKMIQPINMGLGAPLGSGQQYMSWIHYEDVANAFLYALDNNLDGPYNLTAPLPVTNKELTRTIAKMLNKPFFVPRIPSLLLHLVLGEMATAVTANTRASSEKLASTGFEFKYPDLQSTLTHLLFNNNHF